MISAYTNMPDSYWKEHHIESLINKFPEGQVVIKINGELAGCALSIIVDYDSFEEVHTYKDITGDYSFSTHSSDGDVLYGIDVFIKPTFRGLRLGRRLYDYRKEVAENLAVSFHKQMKSFGNFYNLHSPCLTCHFIPVYIVISGCTSTIGNHRPH